MVFLCDDEPFEIPSAVASIVSGLPGWECTIAGLPGHASFSGTWTNFRRYSALYGAAGFPVRAAQMLLLRLSARLGLPTARPHSLARAAERCSAAFIRIGSVNSPGGRRILEGLQPDFLVSIACPQILRGRVLAIPRIAALNLHSALLPRNRGMLPTFWSLMEDPPRAGVTLHLMERGLDAGPILLQREIPVDRRTTSLHALIRMCKREGAGLVVQGLRMMASGPVDLLPNPPGEGCVHSFPSASDVRAFRRKGGRIW